jgi:hypothetical protein
LKTKWMKKNSLSISRCRCLHALPPVVSKLTGFQDSEPGVGFGWFGAETWVGPCLPPSFLSSSPAKNRACEGLAVKEKAQGWCGPQRSEDTALRALTARHCGLRSREKAMNLGKDEERLMGQGLR